MRVHARIYFPVESNRLAAMLAAANECWPGCWSGVEMDSVVVTDGPAGKDPMPASRAVAELVGPTHRRGSRWGEVVPLTKGHPS